MFSPPVSSGKNGPTSLASGAFSGSSKAEFLLSGMGMGYSMGLDGMGGKKLGMVSLDPMGLGLEGGETLLGSGLLPPPPSPPPLLVPMEVYP